MFHRINGMGNVNPFLILVLHILILPYWLFYICKGAYDFVYTVNMSLFDSSVEHTCSASQRWTEVLPVRLFNEPPAMYPPLLK